MDNGLPIAIAISQRSKRQMVSSASFFAIARSRILQHSNTPANSSNLSIGNNNLDNMHQMSSIHPTNRSTSARTDASSIGSSSYLSTLQLESDDDSESHSDDLNDTKIYQQMIDGVRTLPLRKRRRRRRRRRRRWWQRPD